MFLVGLQKLYDPTTGGRETLVNEFCRDAAPSDPLDARRVIGLNALETKRATRKQRKKKKRMRD